MNCGMFVSQALNIFFLTFSGLELKACLVLLHQGLVDSGVVCGRHLAVEGDATR